LIEYEIKNPTFFIKALSSIAIIAEHIILQFGSRLRTYGMDTGGLCVYEMVIGKDDIKIISDEEVSAIFYLPDLQKILSRISSTKSLTLIYANYQLTVKANIDNKSKTFKIAELDEELMPDIIPKLDKLDLSCVFNIELADLLDMIQDAKIYKDEFTIKTHGSYITLTCNGIIGEMESKIIIEPPPTSSTSCTYSIDLGEKIFKALGGNDVIVSFGKNMPIMIFNKLSPSSYIKWYLAPRVEQEDF